MRYLSLAATVAAGLVGSGCATPRFQNRDPHVRIVPERLVVFPPVVSSYVLDASDQVTERSEWAGQTRGLMTARVTALLAPGRVATPAALAACGAACDTFLTWGIGAALEIAKQKTGAEDYGEPFRFVGSWRDLVNLGPLRKTLNADFALLLVFSDIHKTAGRVVEGTAGGSSISEKQTGVACVVNLVDGRMVWCDANHNAWPDLRTPAGATAAVSDLLAEIYGPRPRPVYPARPPSSLPP